MKEITFTIPSFIEFREIKANNILYMSGVAYDREHDSTTERIIIPLPETDKTWVIKDYNTTSITVMEY